MKNTHIVSAMALVFLAASAVTPAFAVKDNQHGVKGEQERDEHASKSEGFKEKVKTRVDAARKKTLARWWQSEAKRLKKQIAHEKKFADRIAARLDTLSSQGQDVTKLRTDLATARASIDAAQHLLDSDTLLVDGIIATNTSKEAFAKLHTMTKAIHAQIVVAHKQLAKVLAATHGLSESSESPTPTPTATVTPTPSA